MTDISIQMTYKRIYTMIFLVCLFASLGLIFGDGEILLFMGSSVGVISGLYVLFGKRSKLSPSSATLLFYRTLCDVGVGIRLLFHPLEKFHVCGSINCEMEDPKNHDNEDRCRLASSTFEFFQIASEMWLLCVALDLAVIMSNPFSSFKARLKKYHMIVWITSFIFAVALGRNQNAYGYWGVNDSLNTSICWFDSDPDQIGNHTKTDNSSETVSSDVNYLPFVFFYIPVIVFYSYIIYVMICAKRILSRGIHTSFLHRIHTLEISRFILKVFLGYWTVQAICYFTSDFVLDSSKKVASNLYKILLFGMSAKGFPCLLVYIIMMKSERKLMIHNTRERKDSEAKQQELKKISITNPLNLSDIPTQSIINSTENDDIFDDSFFDVNTTLQNQVFVYITLGMKILGKRIATTDKELNTIRFKVPQNFIVPSDDLKAITDGEPNNLQELVSCNHDQVLSTIVRANSEISSIINQQNSPKSSLTKQVSFSKQDSFSKHGSFDSTISQQESNDFTVEDIENQSDNRASITSPHRSRKFSFQNSLFLGSGNESGSFCEALGTKIYQTLRLSSLILELNDSVEFTEYLPGIFQSIRLLYGILDDYAVAFDRDIQSKVTEGGASNALFFYSRCGRFIAKSCTISEMSHIRQVAPQLADYFRQQRNTLITKIFGAYKLKMYACDLYFIVTNNIKYTIPGETVTDVYDLKGSSINRFMKLPKDGDTPVCKYCGNRFEYNSKTHIRKRKSSRVISVSENISYASRISAGLGDFRESSFQRRGCPMFRHEPEAVLKDNDLRTRPKFRFSPEESKAIKTQLFHDCSFLRELGVMDYSLLVAVYKKVTPLIRENPIDENKMAAESSTISRRVQAVEIHAEYAYYLGIIDYQQEYNWRKKIENFVKVNISGEPPDELSCVSPADYSNRFYSFMCDLVSGNLGE